MPGRILINGCFLSHEPTGIQRYSWEISSRLLSGANNAHLLIPGGLKIAAGYDFTSLPKPEIVGGGNIRLWEQLTLPRLVKVGDSLWTPAGLGPLNAPRHLLTVHDLSVLEHPEWFSRRYALFYRALQPIAIRRASALSAVSHFTKGRIEKLLHISQQRISVVGNAVSSEMHSRSQHQDAHIRAEMGIPGKYILAVGSVEPRKNLPRLVAAFQLVAKSNPDLFLVVVGSHRAIYGSVDLSPGAVNRVMMTGYVLNEQLGALYRGATIFAYPSVYEGFGIPPLEAMACGVPVLTSNVTALPEVVADAAVTVDPLDVDAIAAKLNDLLLNNELREACVSRGLKRAASFTWDNSASAILEVLLRLQESEVSK
jgi:glycosyltransferase involved in cell wall biosynthesis